MRGWHEFEAVLPEQYFRTPGPGALQPEKRLMLAVLEDHDRWMQDTFRRLVHERGGESPLGQLRALFDVAEQILASDDFQGCIFVNVAIEFPLPHEPAHMLASQNKQAIEEFICQLAQEAGADEPHALAQELCLIIEGAYVTRHVTGNRSTIEIARRLADMAITARSPSA